MERHAGARAASGRPRGSCSLVRAGTERASSWAPPRFSRRPVSRPRARGRHKRVEARLGLALPHGRRPETSLFFLTLGSMRRLRLLRQDSVSAQSVPKPSETVRLNECSQGPKPWIEPTSRHLPTPPATILRTPWRFKPFAAAEVPPGSAPHALSGHR